MDKTTKKAGNGEMAKEMTARRRNGINGWKDVDKFK